MIIREEERSASDVKSRAQIIVIMNSHMVQSSRAFNLLPSKDDRQGSAIVLRLFPVWDQPSSPQHSRLVPYSMPGSHFSSSLLDDVILRVRCGRYGSLAGESINQSINHAHE